MTPYSETNSCYYGSSIFYISDTVATEFDGPGARKLGVLRAK